MHIRTYAAHASEECVEYGEGRAIEGSEIKIMRAHVPNNGHTINYETMQ